MLEIGREGYAVSEHDAISERICDIRIYVALVLKKTRGRCEMYFRKDGVFFRRDLSSGHCSPN